MDPKAEHHKTIGSAVRVEAKGLEWRSPPEMVQKFLLLQTV